jgi:hypothetical protein
MRLSSRGELPREMTSSEGRGRGWSDGQTVATLVRTNTQLRESRQYCILLIQGLGQTVPFTLSQLGRNFFFKNNKVIDEIWSSGPWSERGKQGGSVIQGARTRRPPPPVACGCFERRFPVSRFKDAHFRGPAAAHIRVCRSPAATRFISFPTEPQVSALPPAGRPPLRT